MQVEKDEDFIKAVAALGTLAEEVVKANNAVDIYEDYFAARQLEQNTEAPYAKTITILRDPSPVAREAQYLAWHPDSARKLAVAFSMLGFQQLPEDAPLASYIWDMGNPNVPELELTPQSQLTVLNYNLKDPQHLGAGQYNGQLAYFDIRKGSLPIDTTPVEKSHRCGVGVSPLRRRGLCCSLCPHDGLYLNV